MLIRWILTLAIVGGQLIRIPLGREGAINLLDITVIILCLLGLWQIKLHLQKPPLFIKAAIIFILVAFLSLILTPLQLSIPQYLTSFFYNIRFSFYIFLGWLLSSGAFPSLRKNVKYVLLFSGGGLASLGLLQFIFLPDLQFLTKAGWDPHYFRTVSTFLDPNFAGGYFVLTLILLLSQKNRQLVIYIFVIIYLALLTTFSRSSYLMFLVSGLTLSLLKESKLYALVSLLLFLGLLTGFYIYSQAIAEPRNIEREKSASYRLNTWQQGWQLFQSHPILGVGYNSYRYALKEFNLGDEQFLKSHGASSNDSSLLFVLATTGLIGFASYLFFLFTLLKESLKNNLVLVATFAGLVIHSLFANSLFYPPILLWIILKVYDTKD